MAKRTYRNDMSQSQKDKIAMANKGKKLSTHTKQLISRSLEKYWASLPMKPAQDDTPPSSTGSAGSL